MPTAKTKNFDAVDMSRRLREETSRRLSALSREERLKLLNAHMLGKDVQYGTEMELREDPPKR